MQIDVQFENFPALNIQVDNSLTGQLYYQLNKKHNDATAPFFKDNMLWTNDYLIELAKIAKKELGWNWLADHYTLETATMLHKDLERTVGKIGFSNIPEKYDWLMYDLHHCLHSIQGGNTNEERNCHLQIEWFTDDYKSLPDDFEFVEQANFGDVILINPYVGHNPLQMYVEKDATHPDSTCKFHDIIKPGIVIVINTDTKIITKKAILSWFKNNCKDFVDKHGADQILRYSGNAKIAKVSNLDVLQKIIESPCLLELQGIRFND